MLKFERQVVLLISMLLLAFQMNAQVFTGISLRTSESSYLNEKFKSYDVFTLNTQAVNNYVKADNFDYNIQFVIGSKSWDLALFPNDMRRADFVHTVMNENGKQEKLKQDNYSFIGHHNKGGTQKVIFTIMDEFIMGYIQDDGEEYFIEKLKYIDNTAGENTYILYRASDVIEDKDHFCGYDIYKKELNKIKINKEDEIQKRKKRNIENRRLCWELDAALACDWAYVDKHGGNAAAEGFMFGILSLVATNWDDEFDDEIQVVGGAVFSSACDGCDPWSQTTNASGLLNEFTDWGNGGGFNGGGYDMATLWTDRDFNGGTVGIAWLDGVCNNARYNCCQDYTSGTNALRQLQCHEMGHNYGLRHVNGNVIMAPSVNGSNLWSGTSIGVVNANTPYSCMIECIGVDAPIADFTSNIIEGCVVFSVEFEDLSSFNPDQWFWEFPGGTPSTSRQQYPIVEYDQKGEYTVSLTASNAIGSDKKTMYNYIVAKDVPTADFDFDIDIDERNKVKFYDNSTDAELWEWDFDDGTYSNNPSPEHIYAEDGEYYVTLTVTNPCGFSKLEKFILIVTPVVGKFATDTIRGCKPFYTTFKDLSSKNVEFWEWNFPGGIPNRSVEKNPRVLYDSVGVYDVFLTVKNKFYEDTFRIKAYIQSDTASIAGFIDTMDVVDSLEIDFTNDSYQYDSITWSFEDTLFIKDSVVVYFFDSDDSLKLAPDSLARITLSSDFDEDTLSVGFLKDSIYQVTVITHKSCGNDTLVKPVIAGKLPTAYFELSDVTYCQNDQITLNDGSSANAIKWRWQVVDQTGMKEYTEQNPNIELSQSGLYSITLIAHNGLGDDTITRTNYIEVDAQTKASFDQVITGNKVQFSSTASDARQHIWNFGDNQTSIEVNPEHTFPQSGTYLVMYITENLCNSDTAFAEITIDDKPAAAFDISAEKGCAPMDIQFTNTSSDNSTTWSWEFEGGTPSTSTEQHPLIKYQTAGVFDVRLIVKNGVGSDTLIRDNLIAIDDVPQAAFSTNIDERKVDFSNTSTGINVTYAWDFGDGNTSDEENPVHEYDENGKYNVTLVITNNCGSSTLIKEIRIGGTATTDPSFVNNLRLYPNPNRGLFNVELSSNIIDEVQMEIFDIYGKRVWSSYNNSPSEVMNKAIEIQGVIDGTYFLVLRSNNEVAVRKFIVQH